MKLYHLFLDLSSYESPSTSMTGIKVCFLNENGKNLLWDELNLRKREYYVKENRPQNLAVSSSYVRAPTRQETLEAKSTIAGRAFALNSEPQISCQNPHLPKGFDMEDKSKP